jgi:hypothetical protein
MINIAFTLLVLSLSNQALGWRARESFQHFFSDIEAELSKAVTNNCSGVLQKYQNERIALYGVYCVKTYSCIMSNVTEYTKANMASAAVLLGLTPGILATLGSSTIELSLLSSHRPALALLLVLGSPAMNAIRTFEYIDPRRELRKKKWHWYFQDPSQISKRSQIENNVCVIVQLFFAIGSIANLVDLCRSIALKTISVMSCDWSDTIVPLWIGLAVFAHLFGIITFSRRYKMVYPGGTEKIRKRLQYEFTPCVMHTHHENDWIDQNRWFVVWSFLTSLYTTVHLTAGILIFSSLSFVGMLTFSLQPMSKDYILPNEPSDANVCRKH